MDSAALQILPGHLTGGFTGQTLLPSLGDSLVELEQLILDGSLVSDGRIIVHLQRNSRAFGQAPNSVHEVQVFVLFNESEHIPTLPAAEATEDLPRGIHIEARRLLFVERAQAHEVSAIALQRNMRADDIDDVVSSADLLKSALRDKCHGAMGRQEHPNESAADQSHKPGDKFATRLHRVET